MPTTRRLFVILLFLIAEMIFAKTSFAQSAGVGYVFGGPLRFRDVGYPSLTWSVGGGGEHLSGATGVGGDVEVVHFPAVVYRSKSAEYSWPSADILFASGNGYRHFSKSAGHGHGVRPFLTGGGGVSFARGGAVTLNGGGGIDWWADRRTGIRLEVRDQIVPSTYGIFQLSLAARVGFIFR
jgi:hypothetical protein